MRHRVIFGKPLPKGLLKRPAPLAGGLLLTLAFAAVAWFLAAGRRRNEAGDEMIYFWPD